jgi:hypothetical protein
MTIHRVKHRTIPVSAFRPEAAKGYRFKVLRWFQDENLSIHPARKSEVTSILIFSSMLITGF